MAHFLFMCFLLTNTLLCLAMATNIPQFTVQSISAPSSNPPSQSPSSGYITHGTVEPFIGRKLGKHKHKHVRSSSTLSPSPAEATQSEKKMHSSSEGSIPNHQRTSSESHDDEVLGTQGKVHLLKQHHHSFDKSIAGAGVILGGLATTFLLSVFCYIRATGKHKSETTT